MFRTLITATGGLALAAGAAVLFTQPALAAESPPAPVSSVVASERPGASAGTQERLADIVRAAAPSPRPSVPTLEASVVPSEALSAAPRPSETNGDVGDIEVPAGKADVAVPGHSNDLLAVILAGGGALLLAGGAVVVVSRRRA